MHIYVSFHQTLEDGLFFHNIQRRETLLSRLSNLEQYSRQDITILTEGQEDTAWVKEMLKRRYKTQDATQFPVRDVVIDTLENFEGLESPVILFIIPKSWGCGCIGSMKYQLCLVTRGGLYPDWNSCYHGMLHRDSKILQN